MATLYAIAQDLDALAELLSEVGGDVSEADAEAAIDTWLQENADALGAKLDGYGAVIREIEAKATARKAEAERLAALAKTDESNVARMKERLRWFFEARGIPKLETERFKFTLANNGGKTPVEVLIPAETLPEPYRRERTTYSADTDAIREALERGETLDFARLGERGKHLRVR